MIWRLLAMQTHVRPLTPYTDDTAWETVTQRAWAHLRDDWRMYGGAVFWHNLLVTLGVRRAR